jgi:hypothetical protein
VHLAGKQTGGKIMPPSTEFSPVLGLEGVHIDLAELYPCEKIVGPQVEGDGEILHRTSRPAAFGIHGREHPANPEIFVTQRQKLTRQIPRFSKVLPSKMFENPVGHFAPAGVSRRWRHG